ncbi:hypothetical protein GCM10010177_81500 [Actinomadura citrea]|nr:hypothetical protein GCM10010177_81500 [Actinomadura citrea]
MISLIAPMRDVSGKLVRSGPGSCAAGADGKALTPAIGARTCPGRRRRRRAGPRWREADRLGTRPRNPLLGRLAPSTGRPHRLRMHTITETAPRRLFHDGQSRPHKVAEITPPGVTIHSRS